MDAAVVVEADFPAAVVFMPLAGHAHVVIFAVDDAGRAARFAGDERGHHRWNRGLRFLAAERAAHALAHAYHLMLTDAEHFGHERLDLGRVLRGRVHEHCPCSPG